EGAVPQAPFRGRAADARDPRHRLGDDHGDEPGARGALRRAGALDRAPARIPADGDDRAGVRLVSEGVETHPRGLESARARQRRLSMRSSISPWVLALSSIACAAAGVRYGSHASAPDAFGAPLADGATLAPMLENAMPAIVSIGVSGRVAVDAGPLASDPYFGRFLEGQEPNEERKFRAAGSGVIVDGAK